jgi:GNAT superfamily N-acetyltransferase
MRKLVRSRHGRVLEFSQERHGHLVYFKLEFKKASAAYVNCRIEDDVLVLVDLFVQDKCVVRERNFLRRLFGHKTFEVDFRKQGIGSQLLATVIAYAKAKKLKRIEGSLEEKELVLNPRLAHWYQKRGFTVVETTVYLDLKSSPANDDARYMPKN